VDTATETPSAQMARLNVPVGRGFSAEALKLLIVSSSKVKAESVRHGCFKALAKNSVFRLGLHA
jgi:hypothetical protein